MSVVKNFGFCLAFACCGSMIVATPTLAGSNDKVNLSGKLRMLSQRVAVAGCNLNAQISPEQSLKTMTASSIEFSKILAGLRNGNDELDLDAERNGDVLGKLDALEARWAPINAAVLSLASNPSSAKDVEILNTQNLALLEDAKALVKSIVSEHQGSAIAGSNIGILIDVAGRQRMLSQKMSKEVCQIWSGDRSEETRAALKATMTLFETSLAALYNGDEQKRIARPPSRELKESLSEINEDWLRDVRPVLEFALNGGQPTKEERAKLIADLDSALRKSNNVVGLYVNYEVDQQVVRDEGATERVNFSGKLRMLSQRTAALSCNYAAGVSKQTAGTMLLSAETEFDNILNALEYGSPDLKIRGAEKRRKTLRAIGNVQKEWDIVDSAIVSLLKNQSPIDSFGMIAAHNMALLEDAITLASEVSGQYSDPVAMLQADAFLIDMSGRQRMLTQKMSKEACLVWSSYNAEQNAEALAGTMQLFEATLLALRDGFDQLGIKPAPTLGIKDGLDVVVGEWQAVKPLLEKAVTLQPMDADGRADVLNQLNILLKDMNSVVGKYAVYAKTGA